MDYFDDFGVAITEAYGGSLEPDLCMFTKLRYVFFFFSQDNSTTLLHFIVRQHCKEYEDNIGKKAAQFPLPDQSLMTSAAATSFVDLGSELRQLKQELSEYSKKVKFFV